MNNEEYQEIKSHLESRACPYCKNVAMFIVDELGRCVLGWKCSVCSNVGNVGYDVNRLDIIDFSPERQEEWKVLESNRHEFIEKWGIRRSRVGEDILFDQDLSLY